MPDDAHATPRPSFWPVVLLGAGAAGLTAFAAGRPAAWVRGMSDDTGTAQALVARTYDADVPAATALALVVLACWGVVLVARGVVRRVVAALAVLAATGCVVALVAAFLQVPDRLREHLEELGAADGLVIGHTGWWFLALVAGLVSLAASAVAVRSAPAWPEMGRRYDAPADAAPGSAAGAARVPVAERDSLELWKALDDGEDPTA